MAEIRPFRGVRYNESLIQDFSEVICPPYDIISPQQQQELYRKNGYNYIRIEFERELPQDTPADNRYTRSAETLRQWIERGVMKADDVPCLYLHDHYFTRQGKTCKRRNLIARVRLEEWEKMVIRPHEGTLKEARGDRLSLLFALNANTSPILAMYEDSEARIASLLSGQAGGKPAVSTRGDDGEGHDMWVIRDEAVTAEISAVMEGRSLYIADGHHRYESALAYRNEKRTHTPSAQTGTVPGDYVMMSLVEFSDPGLVILAPHRLVRGIPRSTLDELSGKLNLFFHVEEISLHTPDVWTHLEDLLAHTDRVRIVLFGLDRNVLHLLTLNEPALVSGMMPYFHSELYRSLDVSIVDHVILENLLALSSEKEKTNLAFSYDMTKAVERVMMQEYQLALLLSPVKPEMIKAISDTGDKMPRKSTYFYPKSPSGLVLNRLDTD